MKTELHAALRIGLLGGLVASHICLVGMLETFAKRNLIGDYLSMGYLLLLALFLLVGYKATQVAQKSALGLLCAIIAGSITGASLSDLVFLTQNFQLREIFVHASPALVNLLTLGQNRSLGLLIPIVSGISWSLFGGFFALLPKLWQRVLLNTLLLTLLLGLLRDILNTLLPGDFGKTFFTSSGLTYIGAGSSLFCGGILIWAFLTYREQQKLKPETPKAQDIPLRKLLFCLLILFLLTFPLWAKSFLSNVADSVGLYIIMGLGLNLVVGFAGMLDLGFVAFYAIGAYTMAVLTLPSGIFHFSFWQALPFSMLAAMSGGIILGLPILRMRGDYLAIATLGFGEIIRILVISDFLKPYLGGAQGITNIGKPEIAQFIFKSPEHFYYLILIGCLITWFIASRLKKSRLGRAWMAIREDEDVAQAMGINRVTTKLTAFAIGALFGGLSGAIFASMVDSVVPKSFDLLISINVLALIIVGGIGSLPGVLVGALVLVGLPELLREFQEYRLLVYGTVLVMMMLYRPEGLWPEVTLQRILHKTAQPKFPVLPLPNPEKK